jgi:alpha-D-ribose 1-methylphosphonate 5-phosphate C-P lyase
VISLEAEMRVNNLKHKCTVCGKELVYHRQVLMNGPRGFRRYACCDKCADKVEKKQKMEMKKVGV